MKIECSRCEQILEEEDLDFLGKRADRHTLGRHTRHVTQNERYLDIPKQINGGLGGLDWGEVIWITLEDRFIRSTL